MFLYPKNSTPIQICLVTINIHPAIQPSIHTSIHTGTSIRHELYNYTVFVCALLESKNCMEYPIIPKCSSGNSAITTLVVVGLHLCCSRQGHAHLALQGRCPGETWTDYHLVIISCKQAIGNLDILVVSKLPLQPIANFWFRNLSCCGVMKAIDLLVGPDYCVKGTLPQNVHL